MKAYQYQTTLEGARVTAGLTEEKAADALRVSIGRLRKIEKDPSKVMFDTAIKLGRLYNVPVGMIFWGPVEECAAHNRNGMKQSLMKAIAEEVAQPH